MRVTSSSPERDNFTATRNAPALRRRDRFGSSLGALGQYPVPSDTYGLAIVTLVHVNAHNFFAELPKIMVAGTLFLINGATQLSLCIVLNLTEGAMFRERYSSHLPERIGNLSYAVRTGNRLTQPDFGPFGNETLTMCQGEPSHHVTWVYRILIFAWYARMLQELGEAAWMTFIVCHIRKLASKVADEEDDSDNEDPDGFMTGAWTPTVASSAEPKLVAGIHSVSRVIIIGVVLSCRVLIAVLLAWGGAQVLTLGKSVSTLIVKAMSLQYVVSMDEMYFAAFASATIRQEVNRTVLTFTKPTHFDIWARWMSSVIRLLFVAAVTSFTLFVAFRHVWYFRYHCAEYLASFPDQVKHTEPWGTVLLGIPLA